MASRIEQMTYPLRSAEFPGKGTLARLAALGLPDTPLTIRYPGGYQLTLSPSWGGRQMMLGMFERAETKFVRSVLRPGDRFIDVGANIGYYTCLAGSLTGRTGAVLAIEPVPATFRTLSEHIASLPANGVTAQLVAAGADSGELEMHLPQDQPSSHATFIRRPGWRAIRCPVRRLDDLVAEWDRSSRIRIMKIDVEGYETNVLSGASATLERTDYVILEVNLPLLAEVGQTPGALRATLEQAGFARERTLSRDPEDPPPYSNVLYRNRRGK